MAAAKQDGVTLEFVPNELKTDEELVKETVEWI